MYKNNNNNNSFKKSRIAVRSLGSVRLVVSGSENLETCISSENCKPKRILTSYYFTHLLVLISVVLKNKIDFLLMSVN